LALSTLTFLSHIEQFDPAQSEIGGNNLTCLFEVLRDFVVDHRQANGQVSAPFLVVDCGPASEDVAALD
jgi:hypothetical protein